MTNTQPALLSMLLVLGACFEGSVILPGDGAGGQGGGAGGEGGGPGSCDESLCEAEGTVCAPASCDGGSCVVTNAPAGTVVTDQTSGDCAENQCDGSGNVTAVADVEDEPADEACVSYACSDDGQVVPTYAPEGTACGVDLTCNGLGVCVGCVTAADCPAPPSPCQAATCEGEACGVEAVGQGTIVPGDPTQNCKQTVCDGSGNVTTINDDADIPASDSNPCTQEACSAGNPVHTPKPAGPVGPENGVPCNGVCQANAYAGTCGLRLYQRTFPSAGTWTSQALSAVWTGTNAPPPTDVVVAEETSNSSRLVVVRQVVNTKTIYELVGGSWTSAPLSSVQSLGSPSLAAMLSGDYGPSGEIAIFGSMTIPLTAYQYLVPAVGPLQYQGTVSPISDPMSAWRCPQHQYPILWAFNEQRTPHGQEPAARSWKYCNGLVYQESNNDFTGLAAPTTEAASPLAITGGNGSPAPGSILAAYYRKNINTVFMVAP